ncbi:Integrase core domain protein [Anatilimnocola aggregata]|uniref:Integrase core domain protein n=1 Tax=Anatilimnocola aggregata TaxID=2528021 RepID=A0A517Y8P3_9BACT|nr:Integrase core domain protein [Anatilimnocola aggregata]
MVVRPCNAEPHALCPRGRISDETAVPASSQQTFHPNAVWVKEQVESFVTWANIQGMEPGIVQHDRDSKFTKNVNQALRRKRVNVKVPEFRTPNTNAFVERFVQSIQQE